MVSLPEHGVKAVQCQVPAQQPVRHAVDFQETVQLLGTKTGGEDRNGPGRGLHTPQVQCHVGEGAQQDRGSHSKVEPRGQARCTWQGSVGQQGLASRSKFTKPSPLPEKCTPTMLALIGQRPPGHVHPHQAGTMRMLGYWPGSCGASESTAMWQSRHTGGLLSFHHCL